LSSTIETPALVNDKSRESWERAERVMPAGVHNPALYHPPFPPFIERAEGPYYYDRDGNRRLDMSSAHTSLPMGNNRPELRDAIIAEAQRGTFTTGMSDIVTEAAEVLIDRVPSVEKVMFTDSGSKATHYAVRLARAFNKKPRFAKPFGGFHGSWDGVLFGMPWRYGADPTAREPLPGVSPFAAEEVLLLQYNDFEACETEIRAHADELSSILIEPIIGDGYVAPLPGFLELLRSLCDELGIVLIFDEMVTLGVGRGGAQEKYGVLPDLTTMGKIIGGGMPIGAIGGNGELMSLADPRNGAAVPFGATFGGHPLSLAAGMAQLRLLDDAAFAQLAHVGDSVRDGIAAIAAQTGAPISGTGVGHLFNLHWNDQPIRTYADHCGCDHDKIRFFDRFLMDRGYVFSAGMRCAFNVGWSDTDIDTLLGDIRDGVDAIQAQ
jgi:glutamate-1-semialdehyde 2,1-aminomutase